MSNVAQHRSGQDYRKQVQEGGAVGLRDFLANAMAANAVPWALAVMQKFAQHEPLQRHALSLLRSLAASEPPNAPVGLQSIPPPASYDAVMLRAGSIAPVLQALQTHINSPALTNAGLCVLGNLSMEYTTSNLSANRTTPTAAKRGSASPGARAAAAPVSAPLHPAADGAASSLSGHGELSAPPVSAGVGELVPWHGTAQPEEPLNFSGEDVSETTMPASLDDALDDTAGSIASSRHEPRAPPSGRFVHAFDRSDAGSYATV